MRNICCWIMGKASIIMFSRRKEKPGTAVWDGMPLHRRTCLSQDDNERCNKACHCKLEEAVETELPAEGQERDSEFGKFVQKTLGRDLFSSIQITGDGFSQDWAEQSVRLLCYQKRKVFYGNNLFAKGACAAGKEKIENKALKGYRVFKRFSGYG